MVTRHIAVINQSENLTPAVVAKAAAAVQKQVTNDFGPIWDVTATVDDFPTLDDMPLGYWPVFIKDDIGINVPGVHLSNGGEKAFSLVLFTGSRWTVTLSHEILELLCDPFGKTFLTGPSVDPAQGSVEYLVEVCDPCQADACAYPVNGILMSDFVLPSFYKGFGPGKYSFAGNITDPRTVAKFSYMTWRDPIANHWFQLLDDGTEQTVLPIEVDVSLANVHLRGIIDRATDVKIQAAKASKKPRKTKPTADQKIVHDLMSKYAVTTAAQAEWWKKELESLAYRLGHR